MAHRLRAEHEAVLVGVGTVLADNPSLTVRHVVGRNPLRIVADSRLRTPLSATILTSNPENTLLVTTRAAPREHEEAILTRGARVVRLPSEADRVDLAALLRELCGEGVRSVLVEGGAGVITSLLRRHLADRVAIFVAPKIIGQGMAAVGDLAIRTMAEALTLPHATFTPLGADVLFQGDIVWNAGSGHS